MATLTIHNIPDELLKKLEKSAHENGRSVEEEAMQRILSTRFPRDEREREALMQRIRENRRKMAEEGFWTTEEEVNRAKREDIHSDTTGESKEKPDPWLERAKAIRESMPGVLITDDEELNRFKREGRL